MSGRVLRRSDIRVVVYPRHEGQFSFGSIGGYGTPESNERHEMQEAERIRAEILRHVDATNGVNIRWDTQTVCSTDPDIIDDDGDSRGRWPGCCGQDQWDFFKEHESESDEWFREHDMDDPDYLAEFRAGHHNPERAS